MEAAIRRTAARRRCVAADCGDGSDRIQATVMAPLTSPRSDAPGSHETLFRGRRSRPETKVPYGADQIDPRLKRAGWGN
jgi:hypothetical protein